MKDDYYWQFLVLALSVASSACCGPLLHPRFLLAGIGCPSSKVPDLGGFRLSLKTICPGGGVFLQGCQGAAFSLFLAAPLTGAGFPASGRRTCRGTVTPPGPAERSTWPTKKDGWRHAGHSLQPHGPGQNFAPGPVVQMSILTLNPSDPRGSSGAATRAGVT